MLLYVESSWSAKKWLSSFNISMKSVNRLIGPRSIYSQTILVILFRSVGSDWIKIRSSSVKWCFEKSCAIMFCTFRQRYSSVKSEWRHNRCLVVKAENFKIISTYYKQQFLTSCYLCYWNENINILRWLFCSTTECRSCNWSFWVKIYSKTSPKWSSCSLLEAINAFSHFRLMTISIKSLLCNDLFFSWFIIVIRSSQVICPVWLNSVAISIFRVKIVQRISNASGLRFSARKDAVTEFSWTTESNYKWTHILFHWNF